MTIPLEAIEVVRGIFLSANRAATKMISEAPNTWETSLDMALVSALNRYSAPILSDGNCLINIQTHFLGARRMYHNWEIADIGLLVTFRIKGRIVRTKVALLQSKRLYPKEITSVQEDELEHYYSGFSRLYREQEDYNADIKPRTFSWNWSSEYNAIKKDDEQEKAIQEYEKKTKIPVYYLLYHPYRMGWKVSVPLVNPQGKTSYGLGSRIVSSDEIRQVCAGLKKSHSPSAEMLKQVRNGEYKGNDRLGLRLESFIADRVLTCQAGYITEKLQDFSLESVFFGRSAPITSAIAITIDLLDGQTD